MYWLCMIATIPLATGNKLNCFISARECWQLFGIVCCCFFCVCFLLIFYMLINHLLQKKNGKKYNIPGTHTIYIYTAMLKCINVQISIYIKR